MYRWTCSCGDGAASHLASIDAAKLEGQLHIARAGRLRVDHAVIVRSDTAAA